MNQNNLTIFVLIFMIVLGAVFIYFAIEIPSAPDAIEKGYILSHHNNIFIKYSPSFLLFYTGIIFIVYPFLMVKNIMNLGEFQTGDEKTKSKIYLIVYSSFLPSITFLILTVFYSKQFFRRDLYLIIVVSCVSYTFVKHSYLFFIKNKKKNT